MRWQRARPRQERLQPSGKEWSRWKPQIAADCHFRCVYCAVPDSLSGVETRYFTIDHFRPKAHYDEGRVLIANLFYACAVCNSYKKDDWPGNTEDFGRSGYLDPSESDYNEAFVVSRTGRAVSPYPIGTYMIEKIHLNRPQLILRRRLHAFLEWAVDAENEVKKLKSLVDAETRERLIDALLELADMTRRISSSRFDVADYR